MYLIYFTLKIINWQYLHSLENIFIVKLNSTFIWIAFKKRLMNSYKLSLNIFLQL